MELEINDDLLIAVSSPSLPVYEIPRKSII